MTELCFQIPPVRPPSMWSCDVFLQSMYQKPLREMLQTVRCCRSRVWLNTVFSSGSKIWFDLWEKMMRDQRAKWFKNQDWWTKIMLELWKSKKMDQELSFIDFLQQRSQRKTGQNWADCIFPLLQTTGFSSSVNALMKPHRESCVVSFSFNTNCL